MKQLKAKTKKKQKKKHWQSVAKGLKVGAISVEKQGISKVTQITRE